MTIKPEDIVGGNRRALARAITLIESGAGHHQDDAQQLLESLLPHSGRSIRLGISGSPGVGKSTFIESFGQLLIDQGHRVAVLAVDPSSPVAGGSILADKTRMQNLANHPQAFVRPSPSSGTLGGVARKTREAMLLCEAAGFDLVIVETVGVGQSEFQVADMVDFFLVLMAPNAGDDIQGIKKGIVEIADAIVITKTDGNYLEAAEKTRLDYERALALVATDENWQPPVMTCSSTNGSGLGEIWQMLTRFKEIADQHGLIADRRERQNLKWLDTLLHAIIAAQFNSDPDLKHSRARLRQQVRAGQVSPLRAAQRLAEWMKVGSSSPEGGNEDFDQINR